VVVVGEAQCGQGAVNLGQAAAKFLAALALFFVELGRKVGVAEEQRRILEDLAHTTAEAKARADAAVAEYQAKGGAKGALRRGDF